jgi:deoxyribodipyrimidine photolyase-related protein
MATGEPFMFHSRLSFAMNVKLISPLEVINTCLKARKNSPHPIDISQIEGFVRQILGWREYIRGVYWSHMPNYENVNYFNHKGTLPHWYWTGKTHMRCLSEAIGQSLKTSYAHHIQRLMITGNFALLAGVSPNEVDEWYLGIYIDAIQWVELPNTRGMSQFSDGGVMATKPYISSANYIQKMSNHCKTCPYNPKERMGPKACPFNALYWHFLMRHESKLRKNHRLAMPYKLLDKMPDLEKKKLKKQGDLWLERIDHL